MSVSVAKSVERAVVSESCSVNPFAPPPRLTEIDERELTSADCTPAVVGSRSAVNVVPSVLNSRFPAFARRVSWSPSPSPVNETELPLSAGVIASRSLVSSGSMSSHSTIADW